MKPFTPASASSAKRTTTSSLSKKSGVLDESLDEKRSDTKEDDVDSRSRMFPETKASSVRDGFVTKKNPLKQLVVFVNLPGVSCTKVQTFMAYTQKRAERLSCDASAIMICPREDSKGLEVLNVGDGFTPKLCIGAPLPPTADGRDSGFRTRQLTESNLEYAKGFFESLSKADGAYDHIVIIGEAPPTDDSMSSYLSVSGIKDIETLSKTLLEITTKYSSAKTMIRVQICLSGLVIMKETGKTFAKSIVPEECHSKLSMPQTWSVLTNQGNAIDFFCEDNLFEKVAPFLNLAASNIWPMEEIKTRFNSAEENLEKGNISKKQKSAFEKIVLAKKSGVTWDNLKIKMCTLEVEFNYSNKLKSDLEKSIK